MANIRAINEIARKWQEVTPGRAAQYQQGVQRPKVDWQQATAEASDAWQAGVQEAIAQNRFSRGVQEAGTQKWQRKALELGTQRWGPGVQAALEEYERGFAPYRDVIERTTLPPRGRKGDPNNIQRVAVIARALHEAKVGGAGG